MCKLFISGEYLVHGVGERECLKRKHKTDEKFQILRSVIKSTPLCGFGFFFWLVVLDFSVSSSEGKVSQ